MTWGIERTPALWLSYDPTRPSPFMCEKDQRYMHQCVPQWDWQFVLDLMNHLRPRIDAAIATYISTHLSV